MIQRAKKEVFGHFLEFGLLDRLDIAYCDDSICLILQDDINTILVKVLKLLVMKVKK